MADGVDQAALLLNGEFSGRRSMMFHYSGGELGAIRYRDYKIVMRGIKGGLPDMDFYNVRRDPGEKFGALYQGLFAVTPMKNALKQHMMLTEQYPHRKSEVTPEGAELTPHA